MFVTLSECRRRSLSLITQPHADTALLYTEEDAAAAASETSAVADDTAKVNTVVHDFKEHPATATSEAPVIEQYATPPPPRTTSAPKVTPALKSMPEPSRVDKVEAKAKDALHSAEKKTRYALDEAEEEGLYLWNIFRENILRPGVAGGLIGVVVGFSRIGPTTFTDSFPRTSASSVPPATCSTPSPVYARTLALSVAPLLLALCFSAPRDTSPRCTARRRAVKRRSTRHARKALWSTSMLGKSYFARVFSVVLLVLVQSRRQSIFTLTHGCPANVGILGGITYAAYDNWNRPWDRRYVSAATVGLLALWGGEGCVLIIGPARYDGLSTTCQICGRANERGQDSTAQALILSCRTDSDKAVSSRKTFLLEYPRLSCNLLYTSTYHTSIATSHVIGGSLMVVVSLLFSPSLTCERTCTTACPAAKS